MMLAVAMLKYNPSEGFSAANAGAYFVRVVNSNVTTGVPMLFAPFERACRSKFALGKRGAQELPPCHKLKWNLGKREFSSSCRHICVVFICLASRARRSQRIAVAQNWSPSQRLGDFSSGTVFA